jgi:hypothetical protein
MTAVRNGAAQAVAAVEAFTAAVAAQLDEELGAAAWRLRGVGLRFADPHTSTAAAEIEFAARLLAAQLVQTNDDRLAAQTVIDVMHALWPNAAPEDCGQANWWLTPLGQVCGRSLSRNDVDSVTQERAAAMLGITRSTVATLVRRGTLARHADGGVSRAAVLERLARRIKAAK